jgi:tetratricopeptide (TPR) repeat protein
MLEKVVTLDPKYKNALNYLGWTYNALGQYTKAETVLRKAIEVDPKDPYAYNNLGQALAGQVCCIATAGIALGQDNGGAATAQHKIVANTNLVVQPVTVKDARGNLVAGLTAEDFRIFDDGVEQRIEVFEGEALSLVVLVNDDLKAVDAREMAPSLRSILAGIGGEDEATVCRFDLEFYTCAALLATIRSCWRS